ncbi:membrane-bound lytic murein transglycosylase B [Poseidonocella pacifica]|uniref:Membrane-bound lytic murein transglycosylase B n=1 Tax=Poseidonocella pacifica TaxID=871651 RepID=A0A1I0WAH3_9RHOB|nr:lytic murein transglycosylase [Poseidonocella pacifica]SFA85611.1 membrane-bound lytic murein transglycosylase B [Poseidonocella pacifica]
MRIQSALIGLFTLGAGLCEAAPIIETSPVPQLRPSGQWVAFIPLPKLRPEAQAQPVAETGFSTWIAEFRGRALRSGIRGDVFDRAFRGIRYQSDVIARDRNQSEFSKTLWQYLDSAASDTRVANGRAALRDHARVLDAIEARYGVDRNIVVAIWGLESAYGTFRGKTQVIPALATLAYDGRRGEFFEEQLIAALQIVQSGDTTVENMTGSWAGAMGHTQFIPTSYQAYAVDFTGDGRRDIWSDDPADALASTAAYLQNAGWIPGMPWGVEVQLPRGFDYRLADREQNRMPSDWARLGITDMSGRPVRDFGAASILVPAGAQGAAFMIFKNFSVIERYNAADAYVIGVGHLADRIKGGARIQSQWPRQDRALTSAERKELQARLTRAGFDTQGVDGRIGPNTIAAVRSFQARIGLVPDGYASLEILRRLR